MVRTFIDADFSIGRMLKLFIGYSFLRTQLSSKCNEVPTQCKEVSKGTAGNLMIGFRSSLEGDFVFHFPFCIAPALPYGLMNDVKIIQRDKKTKFLYLFCLYSFSSFCHNEKLAKKIFGVDLGDMHPMPPRICHLAVSLHLIPCKIVDTNPSVPWTFLPME